MAKVVLENTTKISLNERFTAYRQQAEASALRAAAAAAAAAVPQRPPVPQPSMRNVRLAQQMASRPSVLAALRLRKLQAPPVLSGGYVVPSPPFGGVERGALGGGWVLQRSLRQRLGPLSGGVKARLGLRPFHSSSGLLLRSRLGLRPLYAGTAAQRRRNRGAARAYYRQPRANGSLRGQFRPRNRRRRTQKQRQLATANGGTTQDRWQLDQQLESYMAHTRSHLDAELDAYMAQAGGSNA